MQYAIESRAGGISLKGIFRKFRLQILTTWLLVLLEGTIWVLLPAVLGIADFGASNPECGNPHRMWRTLGSEFVAAHDEVATGNID